MSGTDSDNVKSKAVAGIKALAVRTAGSLGLKVLSSLILARLLFPKDYGVFGVVAYLTGLGMFLGDVGLSSALIRQHREPTEDETFTVFVSQQILTTIAVLGMMVSAPWLIRVYRLSPDAALLLRVMAVGLYFMSLRIVPMLALERQLRFKTIARCELIENMVLAMGTVFLAWRGAGAWAFVGGGILRGAVGLVCVWSASPYRPRGRFRLSIVRDLMRFGLAFQLNAIVPALVAGWAPYMVSLFLGAMSLGLVNWSINLASTPLMLSAILNRVAFPAYSRLNGDPDAFGRYLLMSVRRIGAVFWFVVPLAVLACPVVIPIVFKARWAPAVPLLQWFCIDAVLQTLVGIVASAQNASGRAGERLGVTIGTGIARWVVGYAAVVTLGLGGIGPAVCLVSFAELGVSVVLVRRGNEACAGLASEVFLPAVSAWVCLGGALFVGHWMAPGHVAIQTCIALLFFAAAAMTIEKLISDFKMVKEFRALFAMLRLRTGEGV